MATDGNHNNLDKALDNFEVDRFLDFLYFRNPAKHIIGEIGQALEFREVHAQQNVIMAQRYRHEMARVGRP